jgi:Flp pilus assembly protein TadG
MMNYNQLRRSLTSFAKDNDGVILPYVAVMMPVLMGFSLLALDAARFQSLQTQMQAAADALALAGARELNQRSGAIAAANSAMANTDFGNNNTLFAMGEKPTFTYTATYYKSLNAANLDAYAGTPGVSTTSDTDAKFVRVKINSPNPINTIFPVRLIAPNGTDSFTTGGSAIAGFTAQTVCDVPPVFVCNPYEQSGDTDSQATGRLLTAFNDPATLRKQYRLDSSSAGGPGHFGYLVPPDGCKGANCLINWIATAHPKTCYQTSGVDLNTGAVSSTIDGFNVRFDIYPSNGHLGPSSTYPPASNVRKGIPNQKVNGTNCPNNIYTNVPSPYYTTIPAYSKPIFTTTGTTFTTGSQTQKKQIQSVSNTDIPNIFGNEMITGTNIHSPNSTVNGTPAGTTVVMSDNASGAGPASVRFQWQTSGLPLDGVLYNTTTQLLGDGNWDCANYWALNHTNPATGTLWLAAPTGCTSSNPTVSRYQVYQYELNNPTHGINDFSGNGLNIQNNNNANGENGAPYCANANNVAAIDPTVSGTKDRRILFVAVINCLAQANLITGGNTAQNIPVAAFAKFFMTQPVGVESSSSKYLYGEMTGFVTLNDTTILNQVQLYR